MQQAPCNTAQRTACAGLALGCTSGGVAGTSGRANSPLAYAPLPANRRLAGGRRGRSAARQLVRASLSPPEVQDLVQTWLPALPGLLAHHSPSAEWLAQHTLTLGLEPVVLPCSSLNCGDITYRSTLDPVLRLEQKVGITPQGLGLLALALAYLSATPGVLAGAVDYYILAPWQRYFGDNAYTKDDIKLGRKVATGGFGTVFRGELEDGTSVIVKKAKEFGEAEAWMNERMMRVAPQSVAKFITAFEQEPGKEGEPLWLVWRYEGDFSLADFMAKKDWPYNIEPLLFGRELRLPKGPTRKAVVLQVVMTQLLEALKAAHSTGIVHRDVKPQNCIVSAEDCCIKLIDWGAAADLRVGINYVPNEYLLDPRYAPPQQYVMSTLTPRAPPLPIAASLSPVLWRVNSPDRFDMYSMGILFLQMAFPALVTDNALIAFNKKLKENYNYDLRAWRADEEKLNRRGSVEGFELLDADGGWDLLCSMVRFNPGERLSAAAALRHPWFSLNTGSAGDAASGVANEMNKAASALLDQVDRRFIEEGISKTEDGALTEARLAEELGTVKNQMPMPLRGNTTIAWWKSRQEGMSAKVEQKKRAKSGALANGSGYSRQFNEQAAKVVNKQERNGKGNAGEKLMKGASGLSSKLFEAISAAANNKQ